MFFLRQLKKFRVNKTILTQFYDRAVTESVLTFSITVWFGSASIHKRTCLKGLLRQPQRSLAANFPQLSQSTQPAHFAKPQPQSLTPLTLQTTSLNLFHLEKGSDPSKLELHALVTVSTQKQFIPNHPTPNEKNRKKERRGRR